MQSCFLVVQLRPKCTKTRIQQSTKSKIFRGRNPRTPAIWTRSWKGKSVLEWQDG